VEALQEFVENFTYLGVFAVLLLGSLGVPIPEEMPIIAAAVLSHEGIVRWWLALPLCLLGVLSGDVVLYWVGWHWGEQVLNWRLVRLVLSPVREQWLKAAYRRHALKTVVTARHVMGLRAAAFLTAGIARVPFWKFVVADAGAALFGVPLTFGLAYFFTDQIKAIMADVHRTERWLGLAGLLALAAILVVVASGRSVWTRNQPRDIRRRRERSVSEGARPRQEGWESSISASGGAPRSVHHRSPVDVPRLTGDVVALLGCEEQRQTRDVVGPSDATGGRKRQHRGGRVTLGERALAP